MNTETIAAAGIVLFCVLVFWFIRTACRWGEQTRKEEAEFEQRARLITPDEQGEQITIINENHDTGEQRPDGNRVDGP